MASEYQNGGPAALKSLRAGAALALVLGVSAGVLPAAAQTVASAALAAGPLADAPAADVPADEQERDTVFVFGRRVSSSMATLPDVEEATQVINVISADLLQEQGVATLEQALRNVPGITTQIGEGGVMSGDQFFIRGLSAKNDIFTDGLRDFGVFTRDSFNYGQVEVLKGPSAAAFGRGAAGGGINTSSKTPYLENAGAATLAVGDAEYMRATGDWNQTFGDGMAARISAMAHHNENTGRDKVYSDRWGVAPSIGFGLDGDTSMTIAYLHQYEEKVPDYGIPTAAVNGIGIPVSELGVDPTNYYGFDADIDETVVDTVTARLRHKVNDWLTLTNDTKFGFYQRYSQYTPVTCASPTTAAPLSCSVLLTDNNPATIPIASVGGPGPYDQDTTGVQNIMTAAFTAPIGGLRNEGMIGLDASWQQNDRNQFAYTSRVTTRNLLSPVNTPNPTVGAARTNVRDTTAKDVSLFITDRLWFTDQWSVTAGARLQSYEVDQNTTAFGQTASCNGAPATTTAQTCYTPVSSKTDFVTPQVGVIFEPNATQNYYVSWSTSATPPGISVGNGTTVANAGAGASVGSADLDPEENENIEAGAKFSLFGERLLLQAAVFQIKKENAKEVDAVSNLIVRSGDSQEVKGIEIGAGGAITDQWSVNASYTWLDATTTDSATAANIGKQIVFTPEQAASLWTTYNFTGALAGLEIGGGLTYQDQVFLNPANTGVSPDYVTLDALAAYGFDRYRISLNAYNLADELYYAQVHGNRVTPGQGRTFIATLGVAF